MYTELMLMWFHLVFNLHTKHDIITNALTSIVGILKLKMASVYIDFYRFCHRSPEILQQWRLPVTCYTAVDVAGQLQENNDQFDPSWICIIEVY